MQKIKIKSSTAIKNIKPYGEMAEQILSGDFAGIEIIKEQGIQYYLFDLTKIESDLTLPKIQTINKNYFYPKEKNKDRFNIQNRRYLGNKYRLLEFIKDILNEKCSDFKVLCDIFAGTGVVGEKFNNKSIKIISNDTLYSNYLSLKTFLGITHINSEKLKNKIGILNNLKSNKDNYFSANYGNTYFTLENARKIGLIREKIEEISESNDEKCILITSLLYATDKVANTVGHYDAYRKKLDTTKPLKLLIPHLSPEKNYNNEIYNEDANMLIKKIYCDVLYLDPPYNSRHYCDAYHLPENLSRWGKPDVYGKAKKMDRTLLKSDYCLQTATEAFTDLIENANCKHILVSYNNTGESKDVRSNAKIKDKEIVNILKRKGKVEIFERKYKAFTTGKSETEGHTERIFYCEVN